MKKLFSIMLSILMIAMLLPMNLHTASAETYSGTCGEKATWTFDSETGTFTISGTGAMYSYDSAIFGSAAPWFSEYYEGVKGLGEKIRAIVIEEGITSIGDYAFYDRAYSRGTNAISITIPDSVTNIGDYASQIFYLHLKEIYDIIL